MGLKFAAPMQFQWICSHGNKLNEPCFQCDVQRAHEIVDRWGAYVDESRMVIEQAEKQAA